MDIRKLQRAIVDGLEDVKAQGIVVFNTEHLSALFERVIVASGTSNRHTKALASSVREAVKSQGMPVLSTEGADNGEWIIVDCGAAVAHIMQPAIRDYYRLEELWGGKPVNIKLDSSKRSATTGKFAAEPAADPVQLEAAAPVSVAAAAATGAKSAPTKGAPTKGAPAKSAPAKRAPTKSAPVKSAPAKGAPAKKAPRKSAPRGKPPAKGASRSATAPKPRAGSSRKAPAKAAVKARAKAPARAGTKATKSPAKAATGAARKTRMR
jgi:ribosome-associated protein